MRPLIGNDTAASKGDGDLRLALSGQSDPLTVGRQFPERERQRLGERDVVIDDEDGCPRHVNEAFVGAEGVDLTAARKADIVAELGRIRT